jgi:hypothetical protein
VRVAPCEVIDDAEAGGVATYARSILEAAVHARFFLM